MPQEHCLHTNGKASGEYRIVKHRSCEEPEHVGMSVCYQW